MFYMQAWAFMTIIKKWLITNNDARLSEAIEKHNLDMHLACLFLALCTKAWCLCGKLILFFLIQCWNVWLKI